MSEYIDRAALKQELAPYEGNDFSQQMDVILAIVDAQPAADVVEVVRCRDCKWFNHYTMECESDDVATDHEGGASFSINFGPDDFCSYGQRKEAAHEVSE